MKKLFLAFVIFLGLSALASAQCSGQFANGQVCGVASGGPKFPGPTLANGLITSPLFVSTIYGGSATNSTLTLQSTNNGSPSGDSVTISGSTIGISNPISGASTINLGRSGGSGAQINIAGTASGSTLLQASAAASGTVTIPATTDTLVGKATTDTLTNKTYNTAGTGNNFQIGGTQVTGTPVRAGDILYNNGSNWVVLAGNNSGTSVLQENSSGVPVWVAAGAGPPPYGFVNCSLAASVASNILTVALKDNAGSDPSASSPCNMYFRNVTQATGSWTQIARTSALSVDTNAVGATLGSSNTVPFRFWVIVFNNGGTPALALVNCSTATQIFPLPEFSAISSTAMSAGATSAGTFYTQNGTTVSSKSFLILGFVEYGNGLTTAGTYASAPTIVQSFGPGIYKPGDRVQRARATTGSQVTTTNTYTISNTAPTTAGGNQIVAAPAVTPISAVNHLRVSASGNAGCSTCNQTFGIVSGGATVLTANTATTASNGYFNARVDYETSNVSAAITYSLWSFPGAATNWNGLTGGGAILNGIGATFIEVEEIMG